MAVDRNKYRSADNRTDRNWPEKGETLSPGDSIEGTYVAKQENVGANSSNVYNLQTAEGEIVGVWGSTVLDAKFESIEIGSEVAIEYVGPKVPKKGGKPYKDYFVGVADAGEPVADRQQDDIPF